MKKQHAIAVDPRYHDTQDVTIDWKEPDRKGADPSLSACQVAEKLGYSQVISVLNLQRLGPERGGLPGYIYIPGQGWKLKVGTGFPNRPVLFYPEDVAEWARRHPPQPRRKQYTYSLEEKEKILNAVEGMVKDGGIESEIIKNATAPLYGGYLSRKNYLLVCQILKDAGIAVIDYSPKERELVLLEAKAFLNEEGKLARHQLFKFLAGKYGENVWNTRSYEKFKNILDHAGIAPRVLTGQSARRIKSA